MYINICIYKFTYGDNVSVHNPCFDLFFLYMEKTYVPYITLLIQKLV